MNLKKFLKPTKWKILTFVIISLLFIPFINYDNGIRCIKAPCPADTTGSVIMYLLLSDNFHVYKILYINLAVGLIISYLLSCMIVSLIKKK
ncbi:MAG: hypothetical protein AABW81_02565 [Nanoarchaeota archaeon]